MVEQIDRLMDEWPMGGWISMSLVDRWISGLGNNGHMDGSVDWGIHVDELVKWWICGH